MFTRIIAAVVAIFFGCVGIHTWIYIATQPHSWKDYLAASMCTVLAWMGFWLLLASQPKEE